MHHGKPLWIKVIHLTVETYLYGLLLIPSASVDYRYPLNYQGMFTDYIVHFIINKYLDGLRHPFYYQKIFTWITSSILLSTNIHKFTNRLGIRYHQMADTSEPQTLEARLLTNSISLPLSLSICKQVKSHATYFEMFCKVFCKVY